MTFLIAAILIILALLGYLRQPVKRAVVEPVMPDGRMPVKLFTQKTRAKVLWEDWGNAVLLVAGVIGALASFVGGMGVGCE